MDGNEIDEIVSEDGKDIFDTLIVAMKKSNEGDLDGALTICKQVVTERRGVCRSVFCDVDHRL